SLPAVRRNASSVAAARVCELRRIGGAIPKKENDPHFEPPYSTISVGTIKGGTAGNIVHKNCEFPWQCTRPPPATPGEASRNLAAFAEKSLLPKMKQVTDEAAIETTALN